MRWNPQILKLGPQTSMGWRYILCPGPGAQYYVGITMVFHDPEVGEVVRSDLAFYADS